MSAIRQRTARCTPALAAIAAALVGLINVASALTPDIRWRGRLLLDIEPVQAMRLFHAFALPAGAALLLVSPYLLKRRRRAWQTAISLMVALGLLDLLKGLDVEETVLTWATAAMLLSSAAEFRVQHDAITLRSSVWRVPVLGAFGLSLAGFAAWISEGHPSFSSVARETGDLLAWQAGPLRFEQHAIGHHAVAWVPLGVHLLEIGTLLAMAYVIFRPLAAPASLPGPGARRAAAEIVRAHGSDTLSFFKLRADKQYFFSSDRSAFVGYRVENGVLLLSGDPVGPDEALAELLADLKTFARTRGLKLAAVGASERLLPLWERFGLRTMYLGDEAIIEVGEFSLEGRPIRKVRQSVSRLVKAGYVAELHRVSELTAAIAAEVEEVLKRGREGAPERGFSMAMDSLHGDHGEDTLVVLARDDSDSARPVRGVLHFVPCFGRSAMSLSFMRRDPSTPNGLTEFMVVSAVQLLRERGVDEMSLNFAAFARWIHSPERPAERALGKAIALGNRFFQIESLYRFNAKFFPRWQPRYLVYEGALGLPRASLAAMWAEGQIPKLELPRGTSSAGGRVMARAR
ncbi:MAG TPA: phosphatidylglycerol lysyltransferase domain-containing protein [Solirubrobacteraceae bacterium]|jgi:lysyl-tRNA synthetase class 2|nr:phosphatidylglycerol lysyltransferase domain-containing protein [Solirubrobacteraceae bacterium]